MARIISSATGSFTSRSSFAFNCPIPCSAEIDPLSCCTTSYTASLTSFSRAMNALPSMPTGWLKLKWRLPSPMCPNEHGRMPGTTFSAAATPSAIIRGTAATGTEMSCLIEAPSLLCTSLICSRAVHISVRSASDIAMLALLTMPASNASSRPACNAPGTPPLGRLTSTSAYQGARLAAGSRAIMRCLSCSSMPKRGISSNAVSREPTRSRIRVNSSSAFSGPSNEQKAVSCASGLGNSFSVAAVMMPSVPSAPTSRSLRS